jgi:hypothetical protein
VPNAPLHIQGGNWNISDTEGDLKIGSDTHRLKIGVATGGGGAGDVRIRSHGGTSRIMLGSETTDVLTISGGNVGIGTLTPTARLHVVGGDLRVQGNVLNNNLRSVVRNTSQESIFSLTNTVAWQAVPGMNMTVTSPGAWFLILFKMTGVQVTGVSQNHCEFRLLLNGGQQDYSNHQFPNEGWELRTVVLFRLLHLPAGSHTLTMEWSIRSPQARSAVGAQPEVRATLTGCWTPADNRELIAIQL